MNSPLTAKSFRVLPFVVPNSVFLGSTLFAMFRYIIPLLLLPLCSIFAESSVWKVSKGGKSLYIGGTCHVLRSSDYPLPPEFDFAYTLADILVFEMDPAAINNPEFTVQLLKDSSYTDGRNLKTVLSEKTYEKLVEKCEQNGLSIEVLNKTKPGMIVMMIMIQELAKLGVTNEGVDVHYHTRGLKDQKQILAFETPEFQIELLTSLGEGIENTIVLHGLQDIEDLKDNFNVLINVWKEGDLTEINTHFVTDLRKHPQLYAKLLVDRNKRWIKSLDKFIKTPKTEFVLVGVAHMAGDEGLLSLLQKKGYTIEQMSVPR